MSSVFFEVVFWSVFILQNGLNFVINYVFYRDSSHFLPVISDLRTIKRPGLTESRNFDMFRFVIEVSLILIVARFFDLSAFHVVITGYYLLLLIFNVYQYTFRRIYQTEPILYSDLKLLKNGLAIVWHESPLKLIGAFILLAGFVLGVDLSLKALLKASSQFTYSWASIGMAGLWLLLFFRFILNFKHGFVKYPNDIYLRFHFTTIELAMNLRRSVASYRISKQAFGHKYLKARQDIKIEPGKVKPNLFLLFVESYGSFYYRDPKIKENSFAALNSFQKHLSNQGFATNSIFSTSTTSGGQSWLAYSSVLYGYRMSNNTLFENHLHDPAFRQSKSLLHLFRQMGYRNYNLNPINPIAGINVPYEQMKEFYAIDRWILNKDIQYHGDEYGWGACAPDQYSMNFMMDLINKECQQPFTYFYLTKNSHGPYLTPEFQSNWKDLNKQSEQVHIHKGFLAPPLLDDYVTAIQYEFDVLQDFISRNGKADDIFLLIGDHQPPILSDEETYGLETPIHIYCKNKKFVDDFSSYGFKEHLSQASSSIRHESFYSIFLDVFAQNYAVSFQNLPAYEPEGLQV